MKKYFWMSSDEFGWLVVLGLTAHWDSVSVYIRPASDTVAIGALKVKNDPFTFTHTCIEVKLEI